MYGIIYCITNTVNGKQYVGQTTHTLTKRWQQHLHWAKYGLTCHLHCAIRKYSASAFKTKQIDVAETLKELNEKEAHHIARLKTFNSDGYNLTSGGEKCEFSPEAIRKMSEAHKGHKASEKAKQKNSSSQKKRMLLKENRRKHIRCKRNHAFDSINTYLDYNGHQVCWTCYFLRKGTRPPARLQGYVTGKEVFKARGST